VIAAIAKLKRLKEWVSLRIPEKGCGTTGQIIVYRLLVGKNGTVKEVPKTDHGSENGTVPNPPERVPKTARKRSKNGTVRGTENGHGNVSKRNETSENRHFVLRKSLWLRRLKHARGAACRPIGF
jgi:hypothetical protein